MAERFLIAGCGRSGTGYVATLFSELGCPCGHESVFNPANLRRADEVVWPDELVGESSWLGTPFIEQLPKSTRIFHQVRHPLDVVRSFMRIRFFEEPSSYLEFANLMCPELAEGTLVDRCVAYWVRWNQMAQRGEAEHAYQRYRLEAFDLARLERLSEAIGHTCDEAEMRAVFEAHPRDYNTRGSKVRDDEVTWELCLEATLASEMVELAQRYGYEVEPGSVVG